MKAVRKLILAGLMVMVFILCTACASKDEKYDDMISEGKSLLRKEEYDKAEEKFDEAIKLLPGEPNAYLELYKLYVELEDYDLAEDVLNEGLDAVEERSGKKKLEKKQEELKTLILSGKGQDVIAITPSLTPELTPEPTPDPSVIYYLDYIDNSRKMTDLDEYTTLLMYLQVTLTGADVYSHLSNAPDTAYISVIITPEGTMIDGVSEPQDTEPVSDTDYGAWLRWGLNTTMPYWNTIHKRTKYSVSGYNAEGVTATEDHYEIRVSLGIGCKAYKTGLNPERIGSDEQDDPGLYGYIGYDYATPIPTEPVTPTPDPNAEMTLVLWDNATEISSNRSAYNKALEELKRQYPKVTIVEESYEYDYYKMKIKAALAANEMPDIFMAYSGCFLKDFVEAGKVYSLDDTLKQYIDSGEISEVMLGNSTYSGKCYGAPLAYNFVGFYANMDLLEKAGWYEIPKTRDELTECCEALLANGITPFDIGGSEYWCVSEWIEPIIEKSLGQYTMKNIMYQYDTWNNKIIADAIDLFQSMIEKGYFGKDAEKRTNDEAKYNFMNGRCAFYQNGTWNSADIAYSGINVKIGEFPVINSEYSQLGELIGGSSEVLAVANTSKNVEKAAEIAVELSRMISNYQYLDGAGLSPWRVYKDDSYVIELTREAQNLGFNATSFMLFGDSAMYMDDIGYYIEYVSKIFDGSINGENFITGMSQDLR